MTLPHRLPTELAAASSRILVHLHYHDAYPLRHAGQKGIALVVVLWVVALLSVIAGSYTYSVRSEISVVDNLVASAQARAAARAGVSLAILELRQQEPSEPWLADGTIHETTFAGVNLRIAIADETGKLDINYANGKLMTSLLQAAGLDTSQAAALSDAILDWRDKDDLRRLNGAEAEDYVAAGRDYSPRNGPFQSVEELALVLGLETAVYESIEGSLTLYNNSARVNQDRATPLLRQAMFGENIDGGNTNRTDELNDNMAPDVRPPANRRTRGRQSTGSSKSVVRIHVEANLQGGTRERVTAFINLNPSPAGKQGSVLAWREAANEIFDDSSLAND